MGEVTIQKMTRELCHTYYKEFQNDPAIYMDMSLFTTYHYTKEKVDAYYDAQQIPTRIVFLIMLDNRPIGEVKLKNIDYHNKQCTLGIHLQNDQVKGKGIGTKAEKLALAYAFHELRMKAVYADAVLKNTRSQHVLEKVGFTYIREDDMFKYYVLPLGSPRDWSNS